MSWDRLPRHTCPLIDSVQGQIRSEIECVGTANSICRELEDIREANGSLRCAAEEAREKADSLEDQLLNAQAEAGALLIERNELQDECRSLQAEIDRLEALIPAN